MISTIGANGTAAEYIVAADLMLKGYSPYWPSLENTECDLVVDIDGRLIRVQVKSGHSDDYCLKVDLRRPSAKSKYYEKDAFELLAICDLSSGKLAYFHWPTLPNKSFITLRKVETNYSNGFKERHGTLMFADYSEIPKEELTHD